jgi:hypothetical protein
MITFELTLAEYNEIMERFEQVNELRIVGKDNQAWALFDVILAEEKLRTARQWQALVEESALRKEREQIEKPAD